jgi:hypothetical protein
MDHDDARRLMAEAMEGRLEFDDERQLAIHIVRCPECKSIYEGLQQANPALTAIDLGSPSTDALEAAVNRATTVLRGEADPGPMGLSEEAPRLPEIDENTVRIYSSIPSLGSRPAEHPTEEPLIPADRWTHTGPMTPVSDQMPRSTIPTQVPEAHVRPIDPDSVLDRPVTPPVLPPDDENVIVAEEPADIEPMRVPDVETTGEPEPRLVRPRSEIETLLDEDRARFEPVPYIEEEEEEPDRMAPGPWLAAIAVTVVLAVLAGILITRGQGLFGGGQGDLPSVSQVRRSVTRALTEMKSLKTTFRIQKLNLYRVGKEQGSLVYSFSAGEYNGHITYDKAEGYKQDFSLEVGSERLERAQIVQSSDETRSLVGEGKDQTMLIESNPPLGPPDGNFRPSLGLLEDSLGTAASMIAGARDLQVVRKVDRDGRQMYEVRGAVRPTTLTRADLIEAALDATTFLPVIVKESISRGNARVLGPYAALTDDALDKAFAEHARVTTQLLQLDNVVYDDIVLPNDLVLDAPQGVAEQRIDSRYERVTRTDLSSKIGYRPLLPRTLPKGFEEELLVNYTGPARNWGPGRTLPKPEHVFNAQYFDGKTTIVVTQRKMKAKFNLKMSPLQRAGLPITVRRVEREDKEFFFGTSPEVPPHAYGFLGNTFVMAVGYAPQAELIRFVASLAETPTDVAPAVEISPSPGASASPSATLPGD